MVLYCSIIGCKRGKEKGFTNPGKGDKRGKTIRTPKIGEEKTISHERNKIYCLISLRYQESDFFVERDFPPDIWFSHKCKIKLASVDFFFFKSHERQGNGVRWTVVLKSQF